jgi:hypothetical protein
MLWQERRNTEPEERRGEERRKYKEAGNLKVGPTVSVSKIHVIE